MKFLSIFLAVFVLGIGSTAAADWFSKLLETQSTSPLSNRFQAGSPGFSLPNLPLMTHQSVDFQRQSSPTGCEASPCLNGATCVSSVNGAGFECKCQWGFTGARCEVCLTECASNPCPANKICKAGFAGGFECVCPPDRAGVNCEIQNDLCSTNPCHNGGVCKEIIGGSYICTCTKPWAGANCEEVWVNPCTEEALRNSEVQQFKNPWDRNSFLICLDKNIYHPMMCAVGTYFNENLHHCVPEGFDPPKCPAGYCLNDGECIIDENHLLKCICPKGFSGERCAVNIDECAVEGNAACQGGICVDQINGYYCNCPSGIGLNCQETIRNPCTPDHLSQGLQFFEIPSRNSNVYLQCTSEFSFSVRKCADNLHWHPEEQTCTVDRPPVKSGICVTFPCKNGGECLETGSSGFMCQCKTGFTGVTCEHMIDHCQSNPCQNGGTCVSYAGGYTCMCPGKVVDECCCHGVVNPCPSRKKIVPGVNNYFQHFNKHRYIHCDFDGRAFVRSCAPGTFWNQRVLTCTPESMLKENFSMPIAASSSYSSYGNQPSNSYGSSYQSAPLTNQQSVNSYNSYNSYQQAVVTTPATVLRQETTTQQSYPSYQSYQSYQTVTQAPPVLKVETTTSYQSYSYPSYQTVTQPPVLRVETTTQPSYQSYQSYQVVTEAPVLRQETTTTQSYQQPYQSYQTVTQPSVLRVETTTPYQSYQSYQAVTQPPVLRVETTTQPSYQSYQSYQVVTEAPVLRQETATQSYQQPYQSYQTVTQPPVLIQAPVVTTQSYDYQATAQAVLQQAPSSYGGYGGYGGYGEAMTTTTPQTSSQIPTVSPMEAFKLLQDLEKYQKTQSSNSYGGGYGGSYGEAMTTTTPQTVTLSPLEGFKLLQELQQANYQQQAPPAQQQTVSSYQTPPHLNSYNSYQGVSNSYDSYQPAETTTQATFLRQETYNPYGQVQATTAAPLFQQAQYQPTYQQQQQQQQPLKQSEYGYGSGSGDSVVKLSKNKANRRRINH